MSNNMNPYKAAREATTLTQEQAAEKLGFSLESLKAYEQGVRVAPEERVLLMKEVYNARELPLQHLQHASKLFRQLIPDYSEKQLAEAVCAFFACVPDLQEIQKELLSIAANGVVNDHEREDFDRIMESLWRMVKCIFDLRFHRISA